MVLEAALSEKNEENAGLLLLNNFGHGDVLLYPCLRYRACKWVTIHGVTPRDWSLLGTKRH